MEKSSSNTMSDQAKSEKLDFVKDEFISILSHELRTPMSTIKGYLDMLLAGDAGSVSPEIRDVLTEMLLAVEREIRLVNGMLDISRLETGKMSFTLKKSVDVEEQARLLIQSLTRSTSEKKISLTNLMITKISVGITNFSGYYLTKKFFQDNPPLDEYIG